MAKPIHQEVQFNTTPADLFDAYLNASRRAEFTGAAATVSAEEGAVFSCHDGQIQGRNIELVEGERIVQAWRVAAWPAGLYTTVRFELEASDGGTKLVMDHFGVPDDFEQAIADGWNARYWEPMKKYFS